MSNRRLNTVHDLAALRLHPDGSRVQNSDTNLRQRKAKYLVRDARGNWIAQDASGLGKVKQQRPHARGSQDADGDAADDVEGEGAQSNAEEELDVNTRARKRRRFQEDLAFLEAAPRGSSTGATSLIETSLDSRNVVDALCTPSSDLLKCLHHFATAYYTSMGQLYDGSKEARRAKRLRRLRRLEQQAASTADDDQGQDRASAPLDADSGPATEEDDGSKAEEEEAEIGRNKSRIRHWTTKASATDMYKLFDGSALMAIGMLVQEHVGGLLVSDIPDGWEQAIATERELEPVPNGKRLRLKKRSRKGKEVAADSESNLDERRSLDVEEDDHIVDRPGPRGRVQTFTAPFVDDDDFNDGNFTS